MTLNYITDWLLACAIYALGAITALLTLLVATAAVLCVPAVLFALAYLLWCAAQWLMR